MTTPGESLRKLRPQINRFTRPKEYEQAPRLSKNWQYLDGKNTIRVIQAYSDGVTISFLLLENKRNNN